MNRKKFMVLVLAGLFTISSILASACAQTQTVKDIAPPEAFTLIQNNQNNPDFVIIDVRTPAEFADGHIADAVNIDFYSATFRNDIDKLGKSQTYLIYCQSGNRSGKARDIMDELAFQEVYNISGGIIAWNAEELPTTK